MFHCSKCDAQYPKWTGRCTECGAWGTVTEEAAAPLTMASAHDGKKTKKSGSTRAAAVLDLRTATAATITRVPSGITELDKVLGGGIVPGAVTLLAGEPGIGKSTLVAQLAHALGKDGKKVYYASGEESEGQVRLRLERLGITPESIIFSNAVDVGTIIAASEKIEPQLLIIDSIQTMMINEETMPGTPTAVRGATATLISYAKTSNVPVLLIGQVTKEGAVAGPKTLEHLVDTVLTLEGDPQSSYRLLRVSKHRFGSTEEVGVFEMTEKGMIAVDNPSARFLSERAPGPGSVVCCIMEGNRPFLVEVQALVDRSFYPQPIRRTSGYDNTRLLMLLAILSKRLGINFGDQDVYVNVVGGMSITEHAADLAVAAALLSAKSDAAAPEGAVFFGELGLAGEIRSVPFQDRRHKEAERLGMKTVVSPSDLKQIADIRKYFSNRG